MQLLDRRTCRALLVVLTACGVSAQQCSNGAAASQFKIADAQGGFTGTLTDYEYFGSSITSIGDLDGDGVADLAVGADGDNDGGSYRGAVWILFLNALGTVREYQKISDTQGGFTGTLSNFDRFGSSVASIGDIDGDSITEMAVG
eukprot:1050931-Prymnesium_polylepis.1